MIKLIVSTDGKAAPFHMAHSTVPLIDVPTVEQIHKGSTHGQTVDGDYVDRHYAYLYLTEEQARELFAALDKAIEDESTANPPFGSDPSGYTRV